ncbi:MAG: thiamine ABC transporter substrate binding subunit [Gammaproteobacteria bacterium]|nr:thiamine ABC transporter substrate binding subunit [Gammaproteobacteria bacterium]
MLTRSRLQALSFSQHVRSVCLRSIFTGAVALLLLVSSTLTQAASKLTVYTYESFTAEWGAGPLIKAAFEKQCDCTVDFVALDSSAGILNRVQLEGESSPADVVLGLDTNLMALAEDTGLLDTSEADLSSLALPVEWDSELFVPFDYGYFAFVYDTRLLSEPPTSLKALVEAPDDLKIIVQDPRTSTPGLGLMLWVRQVYGDDAPAAWEKLSRKILSVTKGWSEAYFSLFLNGEAPMVLSYTTSPAYHMAVDKVEHYQAAPFAEGHYLQVEVAAVLKQSQNKELAREFLQFLLAPDAQSALPLTNVMFPSVDIGDALPAEFGKLVIPAETLLFSPEEVRDNRKAWMDEWLEATTR